MSKSWKNYCTIVEPECTFSSLGNIINYPSTWPITEFEQYTILSVGKLDLLIFSLFVTTVRENYLMDSMKSGATVIHHWDTVVLRSLLLFFQVNQKWAKNIINVLCSNLYVLPHSIYWSRSAFCFFSIMKWQALFSIYETLLDLLYEAGKTIHNTSTTTYVIFKEQQHGK